MCIYLKFIVNKNSSEVHSFCQRSECFFMYTITIVLTECICYTESDNSGCSKAPKKEVFYGS